MAKNQNNEKKILKRGKAYFNVTGEVKISDFTFKIDELSESGWKYNALNLGIDCGNGNVVYADMMGGFSTKRENSIYVSSKEDITNSYTIDWEDRFNEHILETIHPSKFIKIGIEKDAKGNAFTKKFLSEYDAIAYLKEYLKDGMVVNINGNLKHSIYNGKTQVKKEIKSIFLSKAEPENYKATFVQSILINQDSLGKLDKETATYPLTARVVDYTKMWEDKEVKTNVPMIFNCEIEVNKSKPEVTKKMIDKFFKVNKDVTEIIVEGKIVEGQQTVQVTVDDIPEDIKELIELGIYSEEEILNKMAVGGDRVKKFIITKPYVQMTGQDENKTPQIFVEKEKYKNEDLILDFMIASDIEENTEKENEDDDMGWLTELDDDNDVPF
jgi:hypothetical protein